MRSAVWHFFSFKSSNFWELTNVPKIFKTMKSGRIVTWSCNSAPPRVLLACTLVSSKSRWIWEDRSPWRGVKGESWRERPSICPEESSTPSTSAPITQSDRWWNPHKQQHGQLHQLLEKLIMIWRHAGWSQRLHKKDVLCNVILRHTCRKSKCVAENTDGCM